jgi:predicted nucleic acid-binding protein
VPQSRLAWFIDNPVPADASRVKKSLFRDARAVVPGLCHLEVANGWVIAERRGILAAADAHRGMVLIEQLLAHSIESNTDLVPVRQAVTSARTFQLTAYDAVYLDRRARSSCRWPHWISVSLQLRAGQEWSCLPETTPA